MIVELVKDTSLKSTIADRAAGGWAYRCQCNSASTVSCATCFIGRGVGCCRSAKRCAEFVYKAILNVSDVKSCIASSKLFLKLVHIAVVIAILKSHHTIVMSPTICP